MALEVRTDPFVFRWYVEDDGYEWRKGRDSKLRLFGRGGLGSKIISYEPMLESPGLFIDFAHLEASQEAIRAFASEYGNLFESGDLADMLVQGGALSLGWPMETWQAEIGDMKALVSIWEAIVNPDPEVLGAVVTWAKGGVRYEVKTPKSTHRAWLAAPSFQENRLKIFKAGDVLRPAQYALQAEINKRLEKGTTSSFPRLAWTPDFHQRLIFTPSNLLAAMWLQFAQAVTGEFQLRRCVQCGKYFQVGPGGRRPDAKTCSDACRQRKSRSKE